MRPARRSVRAAWVAAALAGTAVTADAAPALTEAEWRWLDAGAAAFRWGLAQGLPLEVTVLPRAEPGMAALAMGFEPATEARPARCRLVLATRGNPAAERAWDAIPAHIRTVAVEFMVAHEVAHCWRRVEGRWGSPGVDAGPSDGGDAHDALVRAEEGFADLAALAWLRRERSAAAPAVTAWLEALRAGSTERGSHDTRPWLEADRARGTALHPAAASVFEEALATWNTVADAARGAR